MIMRVNEIFYSLQGEGVLSGTPSVFVRFSGCNISCPFCDTKHSSYTEMDENEIVCAISKYPCEWVVLTGGEPTMQITQSFIDMIHNINKKIQIETNGINEINIKNIDFITCSPKLQYIKNCALNLLKMNELKVVIKQGMDLSIFDSVSCEYRTLQPCDEKNDEKNRLNYKYAVDYCLKNPKWRLSLQTQKIINIR